MILTTWLIIGFLATALATPYQSPMKHSLSTANEEYKTQGIICDNDDKKLQIDQSIREARTLAELARNYIIRFGVNTALYTAYWPNGEVELNFILDAFNSIANARAEDRTFDCNNDPKELCPQGDVAYINTPNVGATANVHYCPPFFTQRGSCALCGVNPVTVSNNKIRGGSTLHELSHVFLPTGTIRDVAYGCRESKQIQPASNKTYNADSYNCFALEVFALTGCHLCR